jgi:hypothetical protein
MKRIFLIHNIFGSLEIFEDEKRNLLLICPRGIINPSFVKADLKIAEEFGVRHKTRWVYLVNSQNVLFPNPLNLIYLRRIKNLPGLKAYVIYAPSLITRLMTWMVSFVVKPDIILKTEAEFRDFMNSEH